MNSEVLIRAVKTRWNTITDVLKRAHDMRDVLNDLCSKSIFNKAGGVRLKRFRINDHEWTILRELHYLLDVRTPGLVACTCRLLC